MRLPSSLILSKFHCCESLSSPPLLSKNFNNEDRIEPPPSEAVVSAEASLEKHSQTNPTGDVLFKITKDASEIPHLQRNKKNVDDVIVQFTEASNGSDLAGVTDLKKGASQGLTPKLTQEKLPPIIHDSTLVGSSSLQRNMSEAKTSKSGQVEMEKSDGKNFSDTKAIPGRNIDGGAIFEETEGVFGGVEHAASLAALMCRPEPASCLHFRPGDKTTYLVGTLSGHVLLVSIVYC